MANNNSYIKVKLEQIDAQKKSLRAQIKQLDERRKAYTEQLVEEPADETETQSGTQAD